MFPKRRLAGLLVLGAIAVTPGCFLGEGPGFDDDDGGSPALTPAENGWCNTMMFTGIVEGLEATASLSYEPAFEHAYVGGNIETPTNSYSFFGDIPINVDTKRPTTDVMWVEVTTNNTGERFRAELRFHERGFVFLANAYEGAYSTPYEFSCQ